MEPYTIRHNPLKRTFDIAFSLFVLVTLSPLYLALAFLVRLSSRGPIIYYQMRIGRGGRPFKCYKFRSMYPDADARLKTLLEYSPTLKEEWDCTFKLKNDPRVTPIGAFLRKTSLDELPQFWNVLRGDLSVVGPRPVVEAEVQKFLGTRAPKILSVRPGITGIWQVSGRSDTSYQIRVYLDEHYVDKQSFWFDLWLVLKTIPSMLFSKGAY